MPGQANNELNQRQHGKESTYTAADSFPGATSKDVHTGLGHPGSGQVASDIRHKGGQGLQGVTHSGLGMADERVDPSQRAMERDDAAGVQKGGKRDAPPAEDRLPESAETVASERD